MESHTAVAMSHEIPPAAAVDALAQLNGKLEHSDEENIHYYVKIRYSGALKVLHRMTSPIIAVASPQVGLSHECGAANRQCAVLRPSAP